LLKTIGRSVLSLTSRMLWPAARLYARQGYFSGQDWSGFQPRRIAIVACHWIGDTFWASQVVPVLAERFPQARIFAVTKPFCVDLWAGLIPPAQVIAARAIVSDRHREAVDWSALRQAAADLRGRDFDLVIDLTGNRYSAAFSFLLRPAVSLGFGGDELGWLYSQTVPDARRSGAHLSEQPFRVIEPLLAGWAQTFAYRLPLRAPSLTVSPESQRQKLGLAGSYFVMAPGAGWSEKQWPTAKFIQAGRGLAMHASGVVVIGSSAQEPLCREVAAAIPGGKALAGRAMSEVIALLAGSAGLLCNDSGVGHLAAALGVRTAVVFTGVTDPALCRPLGREGVVKVACQDTPIDEIIYHLRQGGG
jgi:ADP-heptose:LPS heptosyltransferase